MPKIQDEFKALQDHQKLLTVMIFSLLTVVVWVVVSLLSSQRTDTIDPELTALSKPLNPSINTEVLSQIEQKRAYTQAELADFPIYVRKTTTQEVMPFSGATRSPTPTATNSGSVTPSTFVLPSPITTSQVSPVTAVTQSPALPAVTAQ